jgi:hypothetical protein
MQEEKIKLLKEALSFVFVRVEIEPLKYLHFVPVSETLRGIEPEEIKPPKAILMDSEMFKVLRHFIREVVVLVVPAGKGEVSLNEVEVHSL